MASTDEIQAKIIEPMRALYRVPFGIEDPERALVEYTKALKSVPGHLLDGAWERVVATHKKRDWPTISELLMATGHTEAAKVRAEIPADRAVTMHPSRVNPPPELRLVSLLESGLRRFPEWEKFMDTVHPTAEHNFFVQAEKTNSGFEVPNEFRREYITNNYGEAMKAHFGTHVFVSVNSQRKYRELPVNIGAQK